MNDLISRRSAIKAIKDLPDCYNGYSDTYDKACIVGVLEEVPTVDAVPVRHGKWIDGHCSLCGCDVPAYIEDWKWIKDMNAKYCPMCGTRMDAE